MYRIKKVETAADWKAFIDLPWSIYKGDPIWVPPLKIAVKDILNVNKNPFFKHAYLYPVLCEKEGVVVGRMVGVIDDNHNRFHNEQTAFFGFFESINDKKVVEHLAAEVSRWSREKGMTLLRGPMNPSTNQECGLLIEGFQDPPTIMMTYNPPYYAELLQSVGFHKAKDLLAFDLNQSEKFDDRIYKIAERTKRNSAIRFEKVDLSKFKQEVDRIFEIYNDAWEKNWGFVPMTQEEFQHMGKELKLVVDPNLLLIAYVRDEPAAFALCLPDIHQAVIKNRKGTLFPFGLLRLLWDLKGPFRKKTITRTRILTLGVRKKFQSLSLGPLFYVELHKNAGLGGYRGGEASWILEDNVAMIHALEGMRAKVTKKYRIYDKAL